MNRRFITRLAQRRSEDYAKFKFKTIDNYFSDDKYEAVNLIPKNTIEFRMFKGTLKKESVFRALEFVDCIIKYCANNPIERCVSYKEFIDYVKQQRRFYPELKRFCDEFEKLPEIKSGAKVDDDGEEEETVGQAVELVLNLTSMNNTYFYTQAYEAARNLNIEPSIYDDYLNF